MQVYIDIKSMSRPLKRFLYLSLAVILLVLLSYWGLASKKKSGLTYKAEWTGGRLPFADEPWFPTLDKCEDLLYSTDTNEQRVPDLTTDWDVVKRAEDCRTFKEKYHFVLEDATEEERQFPIAYSILVHQNIHQTVLLLSSIYTTHNFYCIHVDKKAERETALAVAAMSSCFFNVIMTEQRESVTYASVSRLQADLNCFQDLLRFDDWKYLINLCGQDFPLRTNRELVKQLKALNGSNVIPGCEVKDNVTLKRTRVVHKIGEITTKDGSVEARMLPNGTRHAPPPFNMVIRKNLAYNFFTHSFVTWIANDSKVAKVLLRWSADTYSPDEHYWSMMNTLPEAPGGQLDTSWWSVVRYIRWMTSPELKCYGYVRHGTCVFGSKDVYSLTKRYEAFVNKVDAKYDVNVISCLRHWLDERRQGVNGQRNPAKKYLVPTWLK